MKKALRLKLALLSGIVVLILIAPMVIGSIGSFDKGKSKDNTARPFRNGDLIFQTSQSGQSLAVSYATHSKYTHCGILFNDGGSWYVYEAIGPVKKTQFKTWIAMGDSNYYIVRRLANADSVMTESTTNKVRASVNKRLGIGYDIYFGWNEALIYCSELIWKAYHEGAGIDLGTPKPMKEYDLSHPVVQKTMAERYGANMPYDTLMISPGDVFDSPLLTTVTEGIK